MRECQPDISFYVGDRAKLAPTGRSVVNLDEQAIPNLEKDFEKGDFSHALQWLRKNIHMHGKMYTAKDLIKRVTKQELHSSHFTSYLEKKYTAIYKL